MNEITKWSFGSSEVRTINKDGEPWWVLKDVCSILEITNHKDLPKRLEEDEVGRFNLPHPQSANKSVEMLCINESGLYSVILRSDKPQAKPFRRWVTSEVLPSIRRHGAYMTPETLEQAIENPDFIIRIATELKTETEKEKRKALEAKVERDKPKVLFADAVSVAKTSILVGELAKILKQNGVEIGQNRLFEYLRSNGYLISRNGSDRNMPTQRAMEMGLFEVKQTEVLHSDGHVTINKTPKVTGKGQLYFVNHFLKKSI